MQMRLYRQYFNISRTHRITSLFSLELRELYIDVLVSIGNVLIHVP